MRIRRTTAALALAAAVIVPAATTATAAYAKHDTPDSATHKPAKVAFTATGTITAVDTAAGTVTVAVKGGSKDVRGKTVTIAAGTATRIRLNGKRVALSALAAGNKVAILGVHQSTAYTALQIEAVAAKVKHSPTPAPTTSTPAPSDDDPVPSDDSSLH